MKEGEREAAGEIATRMSIREQLEKLKKLYKGVQILQEQWVKRVAMS